MAGTITISPKFQIAIPKNVREQIGLQAGDRLQVMVYDRRIELIPIEKLSDLKGSLQGIQTKVKR